jgi:predicted PurR-regulated permease PerM
MRDRIGEFLREKTPRRAIAIASFAALIVLFRHLLPLLVFFVAFERSLRAVADFLWLRFKVKKTITVLCLASVGLVAFGALAWLGAGRAIRGIARVGDVRERIAALREHPWFERVNDQLGDTDKVIEGAKHYAEGALRAASAVGHLVLYALIGLILAIIYLLEDEHLGAFERSLDPRSLIGTLGRWLGHLADAVVVTVQLQFIVAACNALMTLPVLLLLGIGHVGPLMLLIFISGLVPVIGNLVSGTVLCILAYKARGWFGVGLFVALTFVLHKIEAYYLNPRLTARHVKLPGFVLIASLIACEHLLGFVGLFVSFPILFVAGKLRSEFREEDLFDRVAAAEAASSLPPTSSPAPASATPS